MEELKSDDVDEVKLNENNNDNSGRKVVKNIIIVAISNIITLASGILVGFILPKIMYKTDYGFYKTFTLYFSYIGLIHLGFIDGIYLLYAGKKYDELDKVKFRTYTRFLLLFQLMLSVVVIVVSIPFLSYELGTIFFCLGINVLFNSSTTYFQFISQITGRYKELSFRNVIKAILTSVAIIVLTCLYYLEVINSVSYVTYIIIYTSISAVLTFWYMFTYRDIIFGKSFSIKEEKKEIIYFFKTGFPLLIANFVSGLILSIDGQFVSVLFDIETYASYAFAYNLLGLITSVISAISVVLYPTIKTFNEDKLKNNYNRLNAIILIFVSLLICSYFPLNYIILNFLPNYSDSLPIFRVILPGLVVSSSISMIMFNYYKALNKQTRYFILGIITLILSACANLIAYFAFKTTVAISVASVVVISIWYILVEYSIVKKYKLNPLRNILYIAIIVASFYLITFFIENVFIGFGIYLAIYFSFTFLLYHNLIKSKFKSL